MRRSRASLIEQGGLAFSPFFAGLFATRGGRAASRRSFGACRGDADESRANGVAFQQLDACAVAWGYSARMQPRDCARGGPACPWLGLCPRRFASRRTTSRPTCGFNLAASRASDAEVRKEMAKFRDIVAAKMTPAQIAEAQRLASEWVPKK